MAADDIRVESSLHFPCHDTAVVTAHTGQAVASVHPQLVTSHCDSECM